MSWQATAWAAEQRVGNIALKGTLLIIANHHHAQQDRCVVDQEMLAAETEQSVRTVRSCLKQLEERGVIKRVRVFGERGQRAGTEFILVGLTKLSEEDVAARARGNLPRPYRQILPVGSGADPTGNCLPLGGGGLPANERSPTGKKPEPYRQTVAGGYIESRNTGISGTESEIEDTRARADKAMAAIILEFGNAAYQSWFKDVILELPVGEELPATIRAPTRFHGNYIRQHFGARLERLLGKRIEVVAHGVRQSKTAKAGMSAEASAKAGRAEA